LKQDCVLYEVKHLLSFDFSKGSRSMSAVICVGMALKSKQNKHLSKSISASSFKWPSSKAYGQLLSKILVTLKNPPNV
jgi:hypothetical protein